MKTNNKIKLVYILAASHSGSTLLSFLLNAHPEICTVGELKLTSIGNPEEYRCSCRQLIKQCPFWSEIKLCMESKGYPFDINHAETDVRSNASPYVRKLLKPLHRGWAMESVRDIALALSPAWRSNLPLILARNEALIRCVSHLTGKKIIVDSSKIGIRLKYLFRLANIDLKVIRLTRDGRGVTLTYMEPEQFADARDPALRGGGSGKSRAAERLTLEQAIIEWRRSNEEANHILAKLKTDDYIQIRYEDLCQDTNGSLKRIFAFLETDSAAYNSEFKNTDHHVVGNGMRLDSESRITLDERWKEYLKDRDIVTFESLAGSLNRRLGYV